MDERHERTRQMKASKEPKPSRTEQGDLREIDPDQVPLAVPAYQCLMPWQPIVTAPFDREIELAVLDAGEAYALVFSCRRVLDGWVKCGTNERVSVQPTHWREWEA